MTDVLRPWEAARKELREMALAALASSGLTGPRRDVEYGLALERARQQRPDLAELHDRMGLAPRPAAPSRPAIDERATESRGGAPRFMTVDEREKAAAGERRQAVRNRVAQRQLGLFKAYMLANPRGDVLDAMRRASANAIALDHEAYGDA